jgi:hypothetical protein
MSSNVAQNYPYGSETEAERASAVEGALGAFDGLRARIDAEAVPLGQPEPDERWWTWACPADDLGGRLHVAGYAGERHAIYAVCDRCGRTFLR